MYVYLYAPRGENENIAGTPSSTFEINGRFCSYIFYWRSRQDVRTFYDQE